jgi:hypothetical protein
MKETYIAFASLCLVKQNENDEPIKKIQEGFIEVDGDEISLMVYRNESEDPDELLRMAIKNAIMIVAEASTETKDERESLQDKYTEKYLK